LDGGDGRLENPDEDGGDGRLENLDEGILNHVKEILAFQKEI
jgi:hypothetical protein